jgi:GNAT superfamily N-acetyltransferase
MIKELFDRGAIPEYEIPEKILPRAVIDSCEAVVARPGGKGYGWFDASLVPQGFFIGLIQDDLLTGVKSGFEHLWWVEPAYRGKASLALLSAFESDCKSEGCQRVSLGVSQYLDIERLVRMYKRRGYRDHGLILSKAL